MNMKGEFPLDAKISARVTGKTKRLLKKLKQAGHSESDVLEYAAMQLAKEPVLLEWEIGEYDLRIHELESEIYDLKSKKQAKLNKLRIIAPKMIDEDTLNSMLVESAKEYALDLKRKYVKLYGFVDLERLDNNVTAKSSIMSTGVEWGYDGQEFLFEVRRQLKLLCHTDVSDI